LTTCWRLRGDAPVKISFYSRDVRQKIQPTWPFMNLALRDGCQADHATYMADLARRATEAIRGESRDRARDVLEESRPIGITRKLPSALR